MIAGFIDHRSTSLEVSAVKLIRIKKKNSIQKVLLSTMTVKKKTEIAEDPTMQFKCLIVYIPIFIPFPAYKSCIQAWIF